MMSRDSSEQATDRYEDFITHTMRNMDEYLRGEREHGQKQLRREQGRPVSYKSGVSSLGYDEWIGTFLCWRCDEEAEYEGYCEAHYAEHKQEQAEDELEERKQFERDPQYLEWLDEMAEADERYWLEHCPEHGCELHDGQCLICVQEEERNDR